MAVSIPKPKNMARAALAYHQLGWCVIPLHSVVNGVCSCPKGSECENPGKHPRIPWTSYQYERPDEMQISRWWKKWPDANIGIVTGQVSRIIVLDVDVPKGEETIRERKLHLPATPTSRTGSGGWHYVYKHPGGDCRNFAGKIGSTILPNVDFRGDGGLIVAPPSLHASGRRYEWLPSFSPRDIEPADPPEWLVDLIREQARHGDGASSRLKPEDWEVEIREGQRNEELTRRAGSLLAHKIPPGEVFTMLKAWNEAHCVPPLPEAEVRQIVESIASREARKDEHQEAGSVEVTRNLTDLGNARRLVAQHGDKIRYVHPWGAWLIWDGRRWRRDDTGEIYRLAKETVETIYAEAMEAANERERKAILNHAARSESSAKIKAMVELAASEPGVPVLPSDLDRDPMALNVLNGTLDLRTGELRPHDPADMNTKVAPVEWDPGAQAPRFHAFIDQIMAGNQNLIRFLQRAIGYSLTASVVEQVLFLCYGTGANGKTVLLRLIREILGDYAKPVDPELLNASKNEQHPTNVADLLGVRYAFTSESEENRRFAEAKVKRLTGNDPIKARFLYRDFFEFSPTHKLWLATNHKPVIRGTDHAIWRRIRLIPFTVTIPDDQQDKDLLSKLLEERSGILAWAVQGCLDWQRDGLTFPEEVRVATESYRAEMDVVAAFLDDCCIIGPRYWVYSRELYAAYQKWAEENGERPMSQKMFAMRLQERGFTRERYGRARTWRWTGLGLVDEEASEFGGSRDLERRYSEDDDDEEPY